MHLLDNVLPLEIDLGIEKNVDLLLFRYNQCSQALSDFLALKITFQEYCDILEFYEIDMDQYLGVIEENLEGIPCL